MYNNPTDIPMYNVLVAVLQRRGYAAEVRSEHRTINDKTVIADFVYAVLAIGRSKKTFDLKITLPALENAQDTDVVRASLTKQIDKCCTDGHAHRLCECGKQVIIAEEREAVFLRDVKPHKHYAYRPIQGKSTVSHCPVCNVYWNSDTVQYIDDSNVTVTI